MDNLSLMECVLYSIVGFLVVFGTLLLLSFATKIISRIVISVEKAQADRHAKEAAVKK
ncbi:MAG: OadG family protein [Lachnospiraceae bacterium]|nr:OadG family protein [Lachnospiraceae bacterium]